jgi:hypothetical protein
MVLGQVDAPLQQQTINAQLSPGQNRQSSPLITLAYHRSALAVITGQRVCLQDIQARLCRLAVRFAASAEASTFRFRSPATGDNKAGWRRLGAALPSLEPRWCPLSRPARVRGCVSTRAYGTRSAVWRSTTPVGICIARTRKNDRREIRKAAETLSFRKAGRELFLRRP